MILLKHFVCVNVKPEWNYFANMKERSLKQDNKELKQAKTEEVRGVR